MTEAPAARVWGIDADPAMLDVAAGRLGRLATRVSRVSGSFLTATLPACDAIVATYALHHIRTRRAKQAFYRRCYSTLRPGGVLVSGDCFPASNPRGEGADVDEWLTYLAPSCGGRAGARRTYRSWAAEDVYVPLSDEHRMLARAGFEVDVPWRRSPFGVLVGLKPAGRRG
jgi:SAM-dependent methyltransferase